MTAREASLWQIVLIPLGPILYVVSLWAGGMVAARWWGW